MPRRIPTTKATRCFRVGMTDEHKKPLYLGAMARRLRIPAKWLRSEAEAGRIPHLRAGSTFLFDPEAVENIVLHRLRESHAPTKGVARGK